MKMFYMILQDKMVLHFLDWPELYQEAMEAVENTGHFIIDCAATAGADLIAFGGAGTEALHRVRQTRPGKGPFHLDALLRTDQNLPGPRLVLRPPSHDFRILFAPSARRHQCAGRSGPATRPGNLFKGGLSLDRLRRGTPEEAAESAQAALQQFGGRRFILAGTCSILTGTPRENLLAVTETADRFEKDEITR